jgi:outer membrane protein insertion porin family
MLGDVCCRKIGFGKLYFDYVWYNPLINEYDLIFKLHLFFGLATPLSGRAIPFGELFHIGGDTTVRGFSYGEIGPQFLGDTIGGKKAFFLNAELIFPITQDMSMRGVLFYDGGAGWDNPYVNPGNAIFVTSNNFDYRHAVGFGIRMLRPMPIRVDWGFKLDPRPGERESQVHFGMTYDW